MNSSTARKQRRVILEIEKNPIITYACQKVGVSRATFYRWKDEDTDFADKVEEAQAKGYEYLNDFTEGKLISKIKNEDGPSIRFWLASHHERYKRARRGEKHSDIRQVGWTDMLQHAMGVLKGTKYDEDQ